jgi:magnesium-transporting ATPase (P-type)
VLFLLSVLIRYFRLSLVNNLLIIDSSKTGTLTEGKMKVEEVWVNGDTYYFSGSGLAPNGALCSDAECQVIYLFLFCFFKIYLIRNKWINCRRP